MVKLDDVVYGVDEQYWDPVTRWPRDHMTDLQHSQVAEITSKYVKTKCKRKLANHLKTLMEICHLAATKMLHFKQCLLHANIEVRWLLCFKFGIHFELSTTCYPDLYHNHLSLFKHVTAMYTLSDDGKTVWYVDTLILGRVKFVTEQWSSARDPLLLLTARRPSSQDYLGLYLSSLIGLGFPNSEALQWRSQFEFLHPPLTHLFHPSIS